MWKLLRRIPLSVRSLLIVLSFMFLCSATLETSWLPYIFFAVFCSSLVTWGSVATFIRVDIGKESDDA